MIKISSPRELLRYFRIPDGAVTFLENACPDTPNGKYPFGEDCFINVMDVTTSAERADMEAHEIFVDVQYLLSGEETILYTDKAPLTVTAEKEGKDCIMYAWETAESVNSTVGEGIVLFPAEAHLPGRATNAPVTLKKAVVKIKASARRTLFENGLHDTAVRLGFPGDAVTEFDTLYSTVSESGVLTALLQKAEMLYFDRINPETCRGALATGLGVSPYTADMLLLLHCALHLRTVYAEKGLSEELYWNTLADLSYKLKECRAIHGINGTFVFSWFHKFFLLERFALGRLQYEPEPFSSRDDWRSMIGHGLPLFNLHIPSAGPLTDELVEDSLRRAHAFFGYEEMAVVCHSWLLYPPLFEVFPENANLRRFFARFTVTKEEPQPANKDLWRIFYTDKTEDLSLLHAETTLQKRLLQYLKDGNSMGTGWAYFISRASEH